MKVTRRTPQKHTPKPGALFFHNRHFEPKTAPFHAMTGSRSLRRSSDDRPVFSLTAQPDLDQRSAPSKHLARFSVRIPTATNKLRLLLACGALAPSLVLDLEPDLWFLQPTLLLWNHNKLCWKPAVFPPWLFGLDEPKAFWQAITNVFHQIVPFSSLIIVKSWSIMFVGGLSLWYRSAPDLCITDQQLLILTLESFWNFNSDSWCWGGSIGVGRRGA